ncbi:MAG TPA: hypothetical protein DCP28_08575 [Cytophagales bacterium]|nr:hypothetical protein [Cytophagales bacterium]
MDILSPSRQGRWGLACLLIGVLTFSALGQGAGDPTQVMKARDHYYMVNENLNRYEQVVVEEGLTVYLRNGNPEKLVVQPSEGMTSEFYFSATPELLFGFVVEQGVQHRLYFGPNREYEDWGALSELIRYQKMDGSLEHPASASFMKQGLSYSDQAWQAYQTAILALQLPEKDRERWLETQAYVAEVQGTPMKEVGNQAAILEEEEGPSSMDEFTQYATGDGRPVLMEIRKTAEDGGHLIAYATDSISYSRPNGKLAARVVLQNTEFLGGPPTLPYSRNTGTLARETSLYYERRNPDEPWLKVEAILFEGYSVGIIVENE